jgi:hypothetical protein
MTYIFGKRAIAKYQYRLVFLEIPLGITIGRDHSNRPIFLRNNQAVDALDLSPKKEMTFKQQFELFASSDNSRFLICTAAYPTSYLALDDAESSQVGSFRIPWVNKSGNIGDFCGIISVNGNIIYKFPFKQKPPKNLLSPLVMSEDGTYAAVIVGEEDQDSEGEGYLVDNPREIWTWQYPDKLQKYDGPWKKGEPKDAVRALQDMRKRFRKKPQS